MTAPLRSDPTIVKVALDARSYDIVVGRGLIGSLGARIAALRPGAKTAVVTDEDVARYHLGAAEASLAAAGLAASRVIVPVGEGSKSFHTFQRVCEALVAERLASRRAKDWAASDRLRVELESLGVTLKDSKDGTTWELRR